MEERIVTKPTEDFILAGADIPVTPEEDEYFQQLEMKALPTVPKPQAKAMSFQEYELHCKMLQSGAFRP